MDYLTGRIVAMLRGNSEWLADAKQKCGTDERTVVGRHFAVMFSRDGTYVEWLVREALAYLRKEEEAREHEKKEDK